ncbi:hypothetical protein O181_116669 [Austropuccinia psidii MF-1]|uniref:Uncharacterized protein n=1 Tax=Austropuccinia psidii MF-1 TaxID=1389203 RepID=A0A9Q3KBU8_9BASI|nr:hypothetical protein [Austropuccinia psidii MF-1]
MYSYLHIKVFLGQENTNELLAGWGPLFCKEKVRKMKNWLKNQTLLSIDQNKELEITPALEKEGPVESTSSRQAPEVSKYKPKGPQKNRKVPRTIKERDKEKPIVTDLTHRGTGSPNWSLWPWTMPSI